MKRTIIAAGIALFVMAGPMPPQADAADNYDQLAAELTAGSVALTNKKVAILPFAYMDGRKSQGGTIISERLTTRIIKTNKLEVVERNLLDKVMGELKLQTSGAIDSTSAKELGKLLGVEAIVSGTLVETQRGKVEVNARLIKTETAQALTASTVILEKDWVDETEEVRQQPQALPYEQPAYQAPAKRAGAGGMSEGFIDFLIGFGAPTMALEFSNSLSTIRTGTTPGSIYNDLGVYCSGCSNPAYFRSVSWEELKTAGVGPIGFRVGGFGKNIGGDLELSYEKRNIVAQKTTWRLNSGTPGNFTFSTDDYATVKSFAMSGDLLFRHKGRVVSPYMGIGLGLSMNSISLPYVKGYTGGKTFSAPTDEFAIGFIFRIPVGIRVQMGQNTDLIAEIRYQLNTMKFDRGIKSESDSLTIKGAYFNIGMGFRL
ncbi:MAG: FlgO family outer membrane protein [bacterium]